MIAIEKSTDEDLSEILARLKAELDAGEFNRGFFHNRNLIEKAHGNGELLVIRKDSRVAAFHFGELQGSGILEVKAEYRGKGYGRALVEHCVEISRVKGVNLLRVTCSPCSSIPFWERMGFTKVPPLGRGPVTAYRILHRKNILPSGRSARVEIAYYHEAALYNRSRSPEPVATYTPEAVYQSDGSIVLGERAIGYLAPSDGKDLAVKIIVDDRELYFDKAKYDDAYELGIESESSGLFFADYLFPDMT